MYAHFSQFFRKALETFFVIWNYFREDYSKIPECCQRLNVMSI
jgi:hypothetical protein